MIDLSEYDSYLEPGENGLQVKANSPLSVKNELKALNQEYKNLHGVDLVTIQD